MMTYIQRRTLLAQVVQTMAMTPRAIDPAVCLSVCSFMLRAKIKEENPERERENNRREIISIFSHGHLLYF